MKLFQSGLAAVLTFLLAGPAAMAQARKPAPAKPVVAGGAVSGPDVIKTIQVTGNQRFTAEQVLRLSGLRVGMAPTQRIFEESRDRLLESGVFETVGWNYQPLPEGGYNATLEVREADQFLPWMIERVPVTEKELEDAATKKFPVFGREIPTTERSIERTAALVQQLAAAKGFQDAVVGRVGLVGKDRLMIIFEPKTPAPRIAGVLVTGTRVVPKGDLQKSMNAVAVGTPFTESNMAFLFENQARPLFEAYGKLKAKAVRFASEPDKGSSGVVVTIEVDEGPEFKLAGVEVLGTPFSAQEIEEEGQWPLGKTANYSAVGVGLNKITAKLRRQGFLKAKYSGHRRLDEQKEEVWLSLTYDLGPRYVLDRLNIVGLDLESEPVIRKMYKQKPGDPFDADYPNEFLNQVRAQQIFDFLGETKADVKLDEKEARAEVTLIFKGEEVKGKRKRPF